MKTSTWLDGLFRYAGILGLSAVLGAAAGCNIHDNTINIPNAQINATTDVSASNVMPAATVPIAVTVQNVFLIDPAATPPPEHEKDAGHIVVYMDDVDSMPLLTTAQTNFSVTIPAETKPGPHKLVCQFHKHDGTPTSTKVEVAINVAVSVGADGGVDVITSVDANINTGSGGSAGGAAGAGGATLPGTGGAAGAGG
jgi:hypothetical protein